MIILINIFKKSNIHTLRNFSRFKQNNKRTHYQRAPGNLWNLIGKYSLQQQHNFNVE